MNSDFDVTIVGAGVVGLAIASHLSERGLRVVVLEKHHSFGSETSSRNSEVIHAGIYYPRNSLKSILSQQGLRWLYGHCIKYNIPHRRIGKYIVANSLSQEEQLYQIRQNAIDAGMVDLIEKTRSHLMKAEPNLSAKSALFSPNTGIIDVHEFMNSLVFIAEENEAIITYRTEFVAAEKATDHFKVIYKADNEIHKISSRFLINSAGLSATKVAKNVEGIRRDVIPRQYYAKGIYYNLTGKSPCSHLIYPVPTPGGLGIHLTLDMAGNCRFGPDVHWVPEINYNLTEEKTEAALVAIQQYLPSITLDRLYPGYCGIRPKLVAEGQRDSDFVIQGMEEHGVQNFINLMGIESPGLTSSLAIANYIYSKYIYVLSD